MWSLKHLGRMALATVWSVGGMGPGKTEKRVTAMGEGGQGLDANHHGKDGEEETGFGNTKEDGLSVHLRQGMREQKARKPAQVSRWR